MNRPELATHLASGLAGWHQLQVVQNLGDLSGEDTARSLIAQIINAQGHFAPATSQLPQNWGATKKRIDVALLGRSEEAVVWYGAIEIKWPGAAFDVHQVRQQIVQDAMRLAFVETNRLNAKFLAVGGNSAALTTLFDTAHPNAADRELRRVAFNELLSRDLAAPNGRLVHDRWSAEFPQVGKRIPKTTFKGFDGRLKTELLARTEATVGGNPVGTVFIWQCNRTRGKAAQPGGQPDPAQ
jgi:hypothetical protein